MVIIFSDNGDYTTTQVVYWFKYFNLEYLIITPQSKIIIHHFSELYYDFSVNDTRCNSNQITGYWYRRGEIHLNEIDTSLNELASDELKELVSKEDTACLVFLLKTLEKCPIKIGSFFGNYLNRLEVLVRASEIGLSTPNFIVTSSKEELKRFVNRQNKGVVLKNFSEGVGFNVENRFYRLYTEKITSNFIELLDNYFPPALFLEYIDKVLEIRSFVLFNKIYSMAILTPGESIDIKRNEQSRQVRYSPFKLPTNVSKKVLNLIKLYNIDSASIDIIVDLNENYYFLEINPIGQFGHLSQFCNLYLEKLIAEYFYENS